MSDDLIDDPRMVIHPSMRGTGGNFDHDALARELESALTKSNVFTYTEFEKFTPLFLNSSREKMLSKDTPIEERVALEELRKEYDEAVDLTRPVQVVDYEGNVLYTLPAALNKIDILHGANAAELDRFVAASKRLSNSPITQIDMNKAAYSLSKTLAANQDGSEIMRRAQEFMEISYDFDQRMGHIPTKQPPAQETPKKTKEEDLDLPPDQLLFE